jgi:hypothetical protein
MTSPQFKKNHRMHLPSFKQCSSQNVLNHSTIEGLPVHDAKEATSKRTVLIRR